MFASGSAFCTVLRLLGPIACLVVSTGTQAAAQDAKVASSVLVRVGDPAPDATSPEALLGDLLPKLPEVVLATETGHIAFYAPRVMRRQNGTVVGLPAAQRREGLFVVLAGERTVRPVMLLRDQVPDDPAVHFHALLHGVRLGASGHVVFAAEVANTVPKRGAALGSAR